MATIKKEMYLDTNEIKETLYKYTYIHNIKIFFISHFIFKNIIKNVCIKIT